MNIPHQSTASKNEVMQSSYYFQAIGLIRIQGEDRLSLLQRLSSNDLNSTTASAVRTTLLLNNKGHLQDWLRVYLDDQSIWIAVPPDRIAAVIAWLETYAVMDDVVITPVTTRLHLLLLRLQQNHDFTTLVGQSLPQPGTFCRDDHGWLWYQSRTPWQVPQAGATLWGLGDVERGYSLTQHLKNFAVAWSEDDYIWARLQEGIPDTTLAFAGPRHPLELRLDSEAIAWNKGCYVGQEVISRMFSYRKIARRLMGVQATVTAMPNWSGDLVVYHGPNMALKPLGPILESCQREQCWRALALIKATTAQAETPVWVGTRQLDEDVVLSGQLVDCPFWQSNQ